MSKAIEGSNTCDAAQPSRRAIVGSALGLAVAAGAASSAIDASAKSSGCSAKMAAAHDEWCYGYAAFKAALAEEPAATARYNALLPERAKWRGPLNPEQIAACDAAREMSGLNAAEEAASAAYDAQDDLFIAFLELRPETVADFVLQAKCLKQWFHDSDLDHPGKVWLKTITGEVWPDHGSYASERA